MRNILLVEPNYKNKYPPIGLMKIATYHRMLGDKVVFFKGDLRDLLISDIADSCIKKLYNIDSSIEWRETKAELCRYIKTGKGEYSAIFPSSNYEHLIIGCLKSYRDYYKKRLYRNDPSYDRVYVTTLFTFYWKITVDTINFAKYLVKDQKNLIVGGVTATVLANDLFEATGIQPMKGLLDKPGMLDDNNIIIDTLPLDYSILDEIDYHYPENNGYYGYMTRGCIRNCSFCAVPILEPKYNEFIPITDRIKEISEKYGDKRNLLLLDNNVLASGRFPDIIDEIKKAGFVKGATYTEPNDFEITIRNLSEGINDRAYIKRTFKLIHTLLDKLKGDSQLHFYDFLAQENLLKFENVTKEKLLSVAPSISELYAKHNRRSPKARYVDFNQGVDARLINEDNIKLLSEIPIRPLRIAFDSIGYEKPYVKAVTLAAQNDIKHLSNYLLYNEKDKPVDLYKRLKINVNLCKSLDINIYSFPMKFHPITGPDRFNRDYLGKYWNRKFIRAVQTVLNSTKGKIGRSEDFFKEAFGSDEDEYMKVLYMPETYILYRFVFKKRGDTEKWWEEFNQLDEDELIEAKGIIENNKFVDINSLTKNPKIQSLLKHYTVNWNDVTKEDIEKYKFEK